MEQPLMAAKKRRRSFFMQPFLIMIERNGRPSTRIDKYKKKILKIFFTWVSFVKIAEAELKK
jgi:hypothetical protein